MTCSLTMAIAGTLSFGIVGNGLLWSVFTLLLCLFFFSRKSVCLILSIILGVFAFSFHRFVVLNIPFPGNVSQYANSNIAWGLAFVGAAAFIILIGIVIMNQRQQVLQLLAEQEFQKSIIEKQKKQLAHQANHDYLTGLPSLRLANDRLEMVIQIAKRTGNKAALLFMDLDGFKAVNDNYGHDVGDHALKIVADRIRKTIRDVDTACRVGGDEFMIILNEVDSDKGIINLCRRLISNINAPIKIKQKNIRVGASIGVSIFPEDGEDANNMRILADQLMYKAKYAGKNNFQLNH